MNDLYCGGELITELPLPGCPNCGFMAYPCPCGGDGVLPDDTTMRHYQEGLDANDVTLV